MKVFYGQNITNFKELKEKHGYEFVFLGNGLYRGVEEYGENWRK